MALKTAYTLEKLLCFFCCTTVALLQNRYDLLQMQKYRIWLVHWLFRTVADVAENTAYTILQKPSIKFKRILSSAEKQLGFFARA